MPPRYRVTTYCVPASACSKVSSRCGKQRDHAALTAFMVFGLGAGDTDTVLFPVYIVPCQLQYFIRAAQAPEPCQDKDQPPLCIGASIDHLLCFIPADKVEPLGISLYRCRYTCEGIALDQFMLHGCAEKLPCPLTCPTKRIFSLV
jgi:hypothetical protein